MKVAHELRRNYKHAIDGVYRIATEEGVSALFNGMSMAVGRAILMTIGQLSFYDQIKQMLIQGRYVSWASGRDKDQELKKQSFSKYLQTESWQKRQFV